MYGISYNFDGVEPSGSTKAASWLR